MTDLVVAAGAAAAAGAVWLGLPDPVGATRRLRRAVAPAPAASGSVHGRAERRSQNLPGTAAVVRARARRVGALAGLSLAVVVGGAAGAGLGAALGAALAWWLPRLEPRSVRRRRERLAAQVPEVADLLAACLASGATVPAALSAVAGAVGAPAGPVLESVVARARLGADPVAAWRLLHDDEAFAPLARALVRSAESGAPLVDALVRSAADLRGRRRGELLSAARVAGVRAVLPLGLCFLPAFALLGVVPVVVSLVSQLLLP